MNHRESHDCAGIGAGIYRIEQATTPHIHRLRNARAGLRSFAPEGESVIGYDPRMENFFWRAGQGGHGIQTAAGASALALRRAVPGHLAQVGADAASAAPERART